MTAIGNEVDRLEKRRHDLLFGVRRSVRYHARRRSFFDRWRLTTNAVGVIFGSATMMALLAGLADDWVWIPASTAALVTVFSAIDLVVGTSKMSRLHDELARRFIEIEKKLVPPVASQDDDLLAGLEIERLNIEADEPPVRRVLDSLCHNELLRSMGYDRSQFVKINWLQRLLSQFIDFREHAVAVLATQKQPI